jgi:hypothetical protein
MKPNVQAMFKFTCGHLVLIVGWLVEEKERTKGEDHSSDDPRGWQVAVGRLASPQITRNKPRQGLGKSRGKVRL